MTNAIKHDSGKLRYDLIPPEILEALATLYTFGADRYGDNNWQGVEEHRYYAALERHIQAHRKGEKIDPDSGLLHAAHAFWNAGAILYKNLESTPVRR